MHKMIYGAKPYIGKQELINSMQDSGSKNSETASSCDKMYLKKREVK